MHNLTSADSVLSLKVQQCCCTSTAPFASTENANDRPSSTLVSRHSRFGTRYLSHELVVPYPDPLERYTSILIHHIIIQYTFTGCTISRGSYSGRHRHCPGDMAWISPTHFHPQHGGVQQCCRNGWEKDIQWKSSRERHPMLNDSKTKSFPRL